MRFLLVSDAWGARRCGAVRTLEALSAELCWLGHEALVVGPGLAPTLPVPGAPGLRVAVGAGRPLGALLSSFSPDAIHIATAGPLGLSARRLCLRRGRPFTTLYDTLLPERLEARVGVPAAAARRFLRWFHEPSSAVLVPSRSLKEELDRRGWKRTVLWSRGVDASVFRPRAVPSAGDPRPVWLYAGPVASGKGLEEFLSLELPGTKWVAGDGPARAALERRFPSARFWGLLRPDSLTRLYSAADALVHPRRDGACALVLLEALACGLPVAAYPVPGPADLLTDPAVASLDEDLGRAAKGALEKSRESCRLFALERSWRASAGAFLAAAVPVGPIPA